MNAATQNTLNAVDIVNAVKDATEKLKQKLLENCTHLNDLELLCELKFNPSGFNPAVGKDAQAYHLIEQINQSMTYLTTALAIRWLEQKYPNVVWLGSLGTQSGTDVYASDGTVLCEVFSAVNQTNNGKLLKDINKVLSEKTKEKKVDAKCYVFCYLKDGAEVKLNPEVKGVEVVYFSTEQLQKIWKNPESFSFNS